ncbi:hypothetical protein F5J12DRAFT_783756 [Pisolithus orientalis]|uniref:uncharacterized protein n=1 Tax=Pisolithus orientalis TaxID=936130 RepID=UPI002224F24F|nr:uncharacterized protein F5J12DRAFT_783756 [Pisolithus orientalis]KAI6002580.1 hypothetical protein F5J12DRAFT_783756 [Pisolithus orientalis]
MAILSQCEASDGDGCGQIFPHKTQPGIYAKCHKLASFQAGSADIKLWQAMPQCKGCGMAWKNLQGEMCGTCETASPAANQVGNCDSSTGTSQVMHDAIETARQAQAVLASVHLQKSPNTSGLPNTLNTTAGLNYAWNGGGQPGSDKIKIAIEVQIKGASKQCNAGDAYRKWMKLWAKDVYLTEVLEDSLTALNVNWEKDEGLGLVLGEVQFCFPGNKNFQPGDQTKTVGYVYNAYMLGESADFYKPRDAQSKEVKGPALFLELYVDCEASVVLIAKSLLTGVNMFMGKCQVAALCPPKSTLLWITPLMRILPLELMVPETGEVKIVWPDDSVETIKGFLGSDVFSKGQTKKVYKLMLNGDLFVAKCFFDIGTGESMTTTDNKNGFWAISVNLQSNRVSASFQIVFSEGFLLCEHEMLSAASGESDCGNYYGGAVWLVKPQRTTTVMKFSGTLEHSSSTDKLGITISAFAHFAYEYSKHKLVFTDIQGSPMTVNGHDGMVLFDVMTHTVTPYGNQLHHSVKLLIPLE